jgi:type IV pilus assembly protein PilA
MIRGRERGFSLIELMIAVMLVGVLAFLAIVGYRRWVLSSHMTEATDLLADVRKAEEQFRSELGVYLKVSASLNRADLCPTYKPKSATAWNPTCGQWSRLNVMPAAPVYFGYAVVADPVATPASLQVSVVQNGASLDLSSLAGQPWYVAVARADLDGNGVDCSVYATSGQSTLIVDKEGE